MLVKQTHRNTTYVSIPGKLLELHFNIPMFSNPGDKVLIRPSLKGGLCMSAGQKNPGVVVVVAFKFEIRVGQSIK